MMSVVGFVKVLGDLAFWYGLGVEDVLLWLLSPTTFFEDGGRPVDHFDDFGLVLRVAENAWGVDW